MNSTKTFDHSGSTFDSFLEEEHILEEAEAIAVKRVLVWKLKQAMKEKKVSKYTLAKDLHTSRSQVDRLLDPTHVGVAIGTLTRAARTLGKQIYVEIVDVKPRKMNTLTIAAQAAKRRAVKRSAVKLIAAKPRRAAKAAYAAV